MLDSSSTTDLAYRLKALLYKRTFVQYSQNAYAIASFFGRAFSVDFNANRSTITMMYKQEPGVEGEELTENQATTLQTKRCNVFVKYVNDTVIIQYGVMSGPAYFDEIHGLDWLQNAIQNGACNEGVNNGLVGPGVWNADGFGELETGDYLKTGFYIYAQPMALQAQSDRETRVAPPTQVAIKLAGAIQELDVLVDVNR